MVKRSLLFVALVLAGMLISVRWSSHAQTRDPAAPSCAGSACDVLEAKLTPHKAAFRRPERIPYPEENPFSEAKARLGEDLFFDPLLSRSGTTSCASCHNPGLSWGDGLSRAVGDTAEELSLRSPTMLNVAWLSILGWDGKFPDLESVTFIPITGKINMALNERAVVARLSAVPAYLDAFARAYGDPDVTRERVENAIATYERTIVSGPAPFDRWIEGDVAAIDVPAKRGFDLFTGRARCVACHSGWAFTDGSFHDIGSAVGDDLGRGGRFPSSVKLRYAFKVPSLRDVARRFPYMHDGTMPTLQSVIDLYDKGGIERPSRSPEIMPLGLSSQDKADLIAFLGTLTSDAAPASVPILPR